MKIIEYKISGTHCEACKKIIEMDLEDAGFEGCTVDLKKEIVIVPQSFENQVNEIATVVSNAGEYEMEIE